MTASRPLVSPLRDIFQWDRQFCIRRPFRYKSEDQRVEVEPLSDPLTVFIGVDLGILDPPAFNFDSLSRFLVSGGSSLADLEDRSRRPRLSTCALIDDRRDPIGLSAAGPGEVGFLNGQDRNWETEEYNARPPSGENVYRKALQERDLHKRLQANRLDAKVERRILHITDLTPLCAIALAVNVAWRFASYLRAYLQRYISNQVYFRVKLTDQVFVMEFHLPYLALRGGGLQPDERENIRHYQEMLKLPKRQDQPAEPTYYYDAQISFLLTGVDEWHWTAYCCVDTYFGSEKSPQDYVESGEDGPSGGARSHDVPFWNPREYYLTVLSRRMLQVGREWEDIISVLNTRLDAYEKEYNATIDENLNYEETVQRIRNYTRAVSILRRFHDTLLMTTESFQDFANAEMQYFRTESELLNKYWKVNVDSIFDDVADLRAWQRLLLQRIQSFDRMRDGLVNASALRESRSATIQGDDIGVLTNMTVAYLPFALATGIFSISVDNPTPGRWIWWMVTTILLVFPTFWLAFGTKFHSRWQRLLRTL